MLEEAKINFYQVFRCGYYSRGEQTPKFGNLQSTLAALRQWAFDGVKPLSETCTYQIEDGDSLLHTYCFNMSAAPNGDFVLVTWNETGTLDGGMASVNGADPAGHAHVNTTAIPPGHIPGYPTYFWFVPNRNVFVSLRFNQRNNGHSGLKLLLSEYLAKCTSHVVYSDEDDDNHVDILGYRLDANSPVESYSPHFWSSPKKKLGQLEFLRNNRTRFIKIIRKSILHSSNVDDQTLWEKLLNEIGIINTPVFDGELRVKSELPFSPTAQQLEEIIQEWEEESGSKWVDVGFELRGENDVKWLSHALVKATINMDIDRDRNGVISADSIISAVSVHRTQLLGLLD